MADEKTARCHYHCPTCDRHFASLRAFDWHRVGSWENRRCVDPASTERRYAGADGTCGLERPDETLKAKVWSV